MNSFDLGRKPNMFSLVPIDKRLIIVFLCISLMIATVPEQSFHKPLINVKQDSCTIKNGDFLNNFQNDQKKHMIRSESGFDNWATFQNDYSNLGFKGGESPDTNNLLWKFNDNGAQKGEIFSTPIVVNDFVYYTTTNGYLYSVNRKTGDREWVFELGKDTYATPTYSNGYIYIGTGTDYENTKNYIYRISAKSGKEDEIFRIEQSDSAIVGAPIIIDKGGVNKDRMFFGTLKNNSIYSYNLSTNPPKLEWAYQVPNATTYGSDGIWSCMAYIDSNPPLVIFTLNSDTPAKNIPRGIFCLNALNGKELWRFPQKYLDVKFQTFSSPTIFFDNLSKTNKILFGAGIYYDDEPNVGKLYCIESNTGAELWNFTTDNDTFGYGIISSPAVAYNHIYFGASNGKLYSLDLNGNLLWSFQTNNVIDGIYSSPAVSNGKIFFGSTDRIFYCLNAQNGSLIWDYNIEQDSTSGNYGVASSPAIAYNRVFVGGCNGYLYCFGSVGSKPPTVTINYPYDQEMINGTVEVEGVAEDDIMVLLVQIKIDDGPWINTSGTKSWSYLWNTAEVSDGLHQLSVRAFDESGFSLDILSVIVNNGGTEIFIQVTSHTNYQLVSGVTNFFGIASHNLELDFIVQIKINESTSWRNVVGSANWYYNWDTTEYPDGLHLIQFRGSDEYNNSTPFQLIVDISNYIEPLKPGNYPMFRGDYNRSGKSDYKVPVIGRKVWKFEAENAIESSVVYYNNRIYFGANDWFVYCLDSKFGNLIWKYETGGIVRSSAAIANKKLFIGSNDYNLYCLNALSGELNWKYQTNGAIDTSPLIIGNSVIFGSHDGRLYSLSIKDGSRNWMFNTGDEIWGSPAFFENCVYIGSLNGIMYCIWATNGTECWSFSTNQFASFRGIYSTPTITRNKIIFGSEDNIVYCLNASTGKRNWIFKSSGFIYSSAGVSLDKVFIVSLEKENDAVLYALPIRNEHNKSLLNHDDVIWNFTTHDFDGGSSPMVSITSGKIVVGSNDGDTGGTGKVYCLDEDTGIEVWNFTTNGDIHGSPTLANKHVYIGSLDNYLYCLGENYSDQNKTKIKKIIVNISLTSNIVLAGETIENITFTSIIDNKTVPNINFNFNVTFGSMSASTGTSSEDGVFKINYFAPEMDNITENVTAKLTVNAFMDQHVPGYNFIDIIIVPYLEPNNNTNNSKGNIDEINDTKRNETDKQDEGLDLKLIIIVALIILILIIIAIEIKMKMKEKK
jgi:outer membrane protein assembly factor BamB